MAEQPRGAGQRAFFRQIAVWLSLRRLAAVNKSLRLVHSVPVEVDEWSRELLHVHSSTLGDPYTVVKPPIGANHEVADFATPQRLRSDRALALVMVDHWYRCVDASTARKDIVVQSSRKG